jgi:hypothetical protein
MRTVTRFLGVLAASTGLIAAGVAAAPAASATSLAMNIVNNTGLRFTAVTYLTSPTALNCSSITASGAFRQALPFGHSSWIGQGSSGTIAATCSGPAALASEFGYLPNFVPSFSFAGGALGFTFAAGYVPELGDYHQCFLANPQTPESYGLDSLGDYVTVSIDGQNCTIDYLPGVTTISADGVVATSRQAARTRDHLHTRVISSVAHVENGKVLLPLQVQGRSAALAKVDEITDRIRITTPDGRVVASGKRKVAVGEPTTVKLRLRKAFQKSPVGSSDISVTVDISRADTTGGTGHDVEALTLNYGESFALPHDAVGGNYFPF